jgi:hypothetical protein
MFPVAFIAVTGCLHLACILLFSSNIQQINRFANFFTQVVGGAIVLVGISSNVGIIFKVNFAVLFLQYLKQFPFKRKGAVLEGGGMIVASSFAAGSLEVYKSPKSTEDRLAYLQKQIDDIYKVIADERGRVNERFEQNDKKVSSGLNELMSETKKISDMVILSVGGWKWQLIGALLLLQGALAGLFL